MKNDLQELIKFAEQLKAISEMRLIDGIKSKTGL